MICKTNIPLEAFIQAALKHAHVEHLGVDSTTISHWTVSDARDAVLPNVKSHFLVAQKLAKHIVKPESLKRGDRRAALGLLDAIPLVLLLVWQEVVCEHDASKPLITL